MNYDQAMYLIENKFKIKRGCIILHREETDAETNAINYLCDELDFSAMTEEDYKEVIK